MECCDCGVSYRNKTVKRLAVSGAALKGSESCACAGLQKREHRSVRPSGTGSPPGTEALGVPTRARLCCAAVSGASAKDNHLRLDTQSFLRRNLRFVQVWTDGLRRSVATARNPGRSWPGLTSREGGGGGELVPDLRTGWCEHSSPMSAGRIREPEGGGTTEGPDSTVDPKATLTINDVLPNTRRTCPLSRLFTCADENGA